MTPSTKGKGMTTAYRLERVEKETEGNCWHCGARIKWVCWISNNETGETLAVGRQCCSNFLSRSDCRKAEIDTDYVKVAYKLNAYAEKHGWDKKTFAKQLAMRTSYPFVEKYHPELAKLF